MTLPLDRASSTLVSELVVWAFRSLLLAGVAGAGLAAFRTRTTALRLFVWTSVLYASIALPLVGWFSPGLQVPMPDLLQRRTSTVQVADIKNTNTALSIEQRTPTRDGRRFDAATDIPTRLVAKSVSIGLHANSSLARSSGVDSSFHWPRITAASYLLIAIFFLARFAAGHVYARKLVCSAQPISNPAATAKLGFRRKCPARFAMSDCISVPVTVGAWHPTILLPADWQTWEEQKVDAVLAHELSHVVRRDPLTQRIALLYRAIFWFNPLAWWLARHLAALAEQASDEAALSGGADRNHYARTLLAFFENLQAAPRRIRWDGVAMARQGQPEQRLERILAWKGTVTMKLKNSLALAILVVAIPVVYLAASLRPANVALAASAQSAPPAPGGAPVGGVTTLAPAAHVTGVAPVGGVTAPAPAAGVSSVGPVTAVAPAAPIAAVPPIAGVGQSYSETHKGFSYHFGYDDEERFVIVSGKSDSFTMSGSVMDARHAEKLKKEIPGDFIWFQRDEKSYIIRDQATIDRARALWAPQEELGKKQEALGKQQEELGKQQEALGSKMEQVRVNVPDMTAELDRLKAKLQKLGPTASMEQIGEIQSEIGELQSKMGEIQSQAGEQQGKFGALQGELGEKQGKLGEQQGELGRQQAELAEKATRDMKNLLDEALKNGKAQPEKQSGDGSML